MAHKLAMESPHIVGDMVEATEFPELARKYKVYGVPKVVINETHGFEGALPERQYVAEIRKALIGLVSG